jgi:hypothetical protein
MKKLTGFIFGAILLMSVFACTKKDKPACCTAAIPENVTAQRNDSSWMAAPLAGAGGYNNLTISGVGANKSNLHDTLVMKINYTGTPETFNLTSDQVSYHVAAGTTSAISNYPLDPSYNNTLTISKYNSPGNIVIGTFSVKFINPGGSDISFLNGKFDIPIIINQ